MDRLVEQVDADESQVAGRVVGLFDEPYDVAVLVELGDPEPMRIGNLLEQDLRGRRIGARPRRSRAGRAGSSW